MEFAQSHWPVLASGIVLFAVALGFVWYSKKADRSGQLVSPTGSKVVSGEWVPVVPLARLSFADSLDSQKFSDAVEAETTASLSGLLDKAGIAVDASRLVSDLKNLRQTVVAVSPSTRGQLLLDAGVVSIARDKAGNILPQLKDRQGRIVEIMKAGGGAKKFAALSTAIVGAAHALSSADIARQLTSIDTKLDRIIAHRRIDQVSALERVYTSSRELLSGTRTSATELELWRLRGDLRQMRSAWRRELELQLSTIDDPKNAGMLDRWFTFTSTTDEKIGRGISDGELHLSLIEYALRLDQALAISAEQWSVAQATISSEINEIEKVSKLLDTKAGYISKGSSHAKNAARIGQGMTELVDSYRALALSSSTIEAELSPARIGHG